MRILFFQTLYLVLNDGVVLYLLPIQYVQKQLQELGLPIEGPMLEEGLSLNGEPVTLHNLRLSITHKDDRVS